MLLAGYRRPRQPAFDLHQDVDQGAEQEVRHEPTQSPLLGSGTLSSATIACRESMMAKMIRWRWPPRRSAVGSLPTSSNLEQDVEPCHAHKREHQEESAAEQAAIQDDARAPNQGDCAQDDKTTCCMLIGSLPFCAEVEFSLRSIP